MPPGDDSTVTASNPRRLYRRDFICRDFQSTWSGVAIYPSGDNPFRCDCLAEGGGFELSEPACRRSFVCSGYRPRGRALAALRWIAIIPGRRARAACRSYRSRVTLSGWGCSFSDEGDRLRRIGIVLESKHGGILTADHLSQHKAQVDTGVSQHLGDSVA